MQKYISVTEFADDIVTRDDYSKVMFEIFSCASYRFCNDSSRMWMKDNEILVNSESMAEDIADFLEFIGIDYVNTGYYDPEEDLADDCVDARTGYWYVSFD